MIKILCVVTTTLNSINTSELVDVFASAEKLDAFLHLQILQSIKVAFTNISDIGISLVLNCIEIKFTTSILQKEYYKKQIHEAIKNQRITIEFFEGKGNEMEGKITYNEKCNPVLYKNELSKPIENKEFAFLGKKYELRF